MQRFMKGRFIWVISGMVVGLGIGLAVKQQELMYKSPIINEDEWKNDGLHFQFMYPAGWHVYSNGREFVLDDRPIYLFPHQDYRVVNGSQIENFTKEVDELKHEGYFSISLPTQETMKERVVCLENTRRVEPDGPFPTLDGRIVCFINVTWGRDTIIGYRLEGNNTNDRANRAVYIKFIESIKDIE